MCELGYYCTMSYLVLRVSGKWNHRPYIQTLEPSTSLSALKRKKKKKTSLVLELNWEKKIISFKTLERWWGVSENQNKWGKDPHNDSLGPTFPSLLCDFSVMRGMEGKSRQTRGRRGVVNWKNEKMKRWKAWQRAFSKSLRLSKVALKMGRVSIPCHHLQHQSQEARLLCKFYSGRCRVSYVVQDRTKTWKEPLEMSADC